MSLTVLVLFKQPIVGVAGPVPFISHFPVHFHANLRTKQNHMYDIFSNSSCIIWVRVKRKGNWGTFSPGGPTIQQKRVLAEIRQGANKSMSKQLRHRLVPV